MSTGKILSAHSLALLLSGAALLFPAPARADYADTTTLAEHDAEAGQAPNAYEQRYGGGALAPLPAAAPAAQAALPPQTQLSKTPAAENLPAYLSRHDYDAATVPNAYEQRYGEAAPASSSGNRAELDISALYDNDPSSNVNGGSSYGVETTVYSAVLNNNWRLFAGEIYLHELEPFGESAIDFSRSKAGVEYSNEVARASVAPTYNNYNGNERVGVTGDAAWNLDENWQLSGGAQLFSRDTPLRALDAGVTANSYNLDADWLDEQVREVRLDGEVMTFSDANTRTIMGVSDTEHFYTSSRYSIDGLGSALESHNTENENRNYFNPGQDVLGLVGGRVTQPLYKAYGITWDHNISVEPGLYWQRDYGASPALTAGYTQHVNYRNDIDASLGVTFARQPSDGEQENDLAVLLNLSKKL